MDRIAQEFRPALDKVWAFLNKNPGLRTDRHNVLLYHHETPTTPQPALAPQKARQLNLNAAVTPGLIEFGLTSLYIRIPKTPRTEPGKNDLHYCQRTTDSGDCRLRPAGAER